jgi:hypothetical protein
MGPQEQARPKDERFIRYRKKSECVHHHDDQKEDLHGEGTIFVRNWLHFVLHFVRTGSTLLLRCNEVRNGQESVGFGIKLFYF